LLVKPCCEEHGLASNPCHPGDERGWAESHPVGEFGGVPMSETSMTERLTG